MTQEKRMKIQVVGRHLNKDLLKVYTVSLHLSSIDSATIG